MNVISLYYNVNFRRRLARHRAGLDVEHIMRVGGRESLDMVLRYTRSVKFEESLTLYRGWAVYRFIGCGLLYSTEMAIKGVSIYNPSP